MKIMFERMRNIFNFEYKIFEGKSILFFLNYKLIDFFIKEVKVVFDKYVK